MATLFVKSGASAAALLRAPALAAVGRLALPLRKSKTVQVVMAQLPFVLKRLSQGRAPMPSEIHRLLSHLPLEGLALLSAKCPLTSVQRQVSTYPHNLSTRETDGQREDACSHGFKRRTCLLEEYSTPCSTPGWTAWWRSHRKNRSWLDGLSIWKKEKRCSNGI